jgi:ADP-ribose pyrophosphatase YjhB (NUDIX family)
MPTLGVAVVVQSHSGILLTKREDFEIWCLPGGAVDDGESIAQAALREAKEETGLDVELLRLVGPYSRPNWSAHQAVFLARPVGGGLRPQAGEVLEVRYFKSDQLPEPLFLWYLQPIRDALAGIGGSAAWLHPIAWPFRPDLSRQEIYNLRDASELSRSEFFFRHFPHGETHGDRREV